MGQILLEEVFDEFERYLGKIEVDEDTLNEMKSSIKSDKSDKMGYRKYKDVVNTHFKEVVI